MKQEQEQQEKQWLTASIRLVSIVLLSPLLALGLALLAGLVGITHVTGAFVVISIWGCIIGFTTMVVAKRYLPGVCINLLTKSIPGIIWAAIIVKFLILPLSSSSLVEIAITIVQGKSDFWLTYCIAFCILGILTCVLGFPTKSE